MDPFLCFFVFLGTTFISIQITLRLESTTATKTLFRELLLLYYFNSFLFSYCGEVNDHIKKNVMSMTLIHESSRINRDRIYISVMKLNLCYFFDMACEKPFKIPPKKEFIVSKCNDSRGKYLFYFVVLDFLLYRRL